MSKIHSDSLESLIEQFLHEKTGSGLISVSESASLYTHLMEGIFPIHHLGYVRFLKKSWHIAPEVQRSFRNLDHRI